MGDPSPNQVGGDHKVDQARTPKELLLKEAIHIRLLKPPQQGWGTEAAWMLDGSPGSRKAEAT